MTTSWALRALAFSRCRRLYQSRSLSGPSSVTKVATNFSPGDKVFGYSVNSVTDVSDLNLVAIQLQHDRTGAQHLHICRSDSNNCFSVGFPTNPMDSTGVAHILEHTVLCGSRLYPVRDPFFKMLTRSLSTFMNAFTACDWTMYPFCTQNEKDFYNLLSVYLDSVFYPQLRSTDFRQEGWRLEHEDPHDQSSPMVFKGIVFNEMKGVFSSPDNIFMQAAQNCLFPSNTYSHVSGGLPNNILDLKLEHLQKFHACHYHPTNGYFYTYGDMSLASHLQKIDEEFLSKFERTVKTERVPRELKWDRPREHHVYCGVDPLLPDENKHTAVCVSFLLAPITDPYESLVLSVISQLLVDGPASPFYQSLLDSNIGSDYSPNTGYDNSTYEASFSVGLKGVEEGNVSKVKDIIFKTFENVACNGFQDERIKAAVHQIELAMKHQSSSFGLSLISSLISPWIHGANPVDQIRINRLLQKFEEDLSSGDFLQRKVREYFLENSHQLTLTMSPNDKYERELQCEEQEKLHNVIDNLSDSDKCAVYNDGLLLLKDQNNDTTSSECLPTLTMSDVKKYTELTKLEFLHADSTPLQYSLQPTNGIIYFKALSSISSLPEEVKVLVPLFCYIITKMGAGDLDHYRLAQLSDLWCGGLSAMPHVSVQHNSTALYEQGILFSSHSVERHFHNMLSLWQKIFVSPNLTNLERLRTFVDMFASNMATGIADSGHLFAMVASASGLTPAARLSETFSGMTQVEYLRNLARKDDLSDISDSLSLIATNVFDHQNFKLAVNCDKNIDFFHDDLQTLTESLPRNESKSIKVVEFRPVAQNVYYEMPFSVNFVAQSYITVPYTDADSPRLQVLAKLLSSKFLHREIREKGGAYGCGVRQGEGILSFFSYRDPHSTETLKVFHKAIEWACSGSFSEKDVDEAKLSVFSQVDTPLSPSSKGCDTFLKGITHDMKQQYRDRLFDVTKDEVKTVAEKYLKNDLKCNAIIGPKNGSSILGENWTVL